MQVTTYEGIVEHGQIRLTTDIQLPENTRVYVVIPGVHPIESAHIRSPRLANPQQAHDFVMEVAEEATDASV